MTKDEIIQMAKDAGAIPIHKDYAQRALVGNENIERFAALVAEKEREAAEDRVITLFEEMDNPYLVDIVLAIKAKANQ